MKRRDFLRTAVAGAVAVAIGPKLQAVEAADNALSLSSVPPLAAGDTLTVYTGAVHNVSDDWILDEIFAGLENWPPLDGTINVSLHTSAPQDKP